MASVADKRLKSEIRNLSQYIERFRQEIARLNKGDPDSNFKNMSDHLDAIIEHTDMATHAILQNLEEISDLVGKIQEKAGNPEANALCDQAMEKTTNAMEACTFQDITGQRVTKIIRSMQFVEERVLAMVDLMGRDSVEKEAADLPTEKPGKDPLLNGPIVAYLCSDEGSWVTGQVFNTGMDSVAVMHQPRYGDALFHPGGWSVEGLRKYFKQAFANRLEPFGLAKQPYPYYSGVKPAPGS